MDILGFSTCWGPYFEPTVGAPTEKSFYVNQIRVKGPGEFISEGMFEKFAKLWILTRVKISKNVKF